MCQHRTSSFRRACFGLVLLVGMVVAVRPAHAIPAYANRLGLPCSACHQPLFARLNRAGWEFRRLGYRLPGEIGKTLTPRTSGEQGENERRYSIADTLSIMARMRYDDIARQSAKRFSQFYVSDIIGFFSGPVEKNWGYFVEADFLGQAPTFNKTAKRFDLPESNFELEFAEVKYFTGKANSYFSSKIGQFGFGGVDGFGANDRPVSTARPMMFTSRTNEFMQDETQRGLDIGYTAGDNHLSVVALNGLNAEGHGDVGRPINSPDWMIQGIHWFGREGSSAQLLYYHGKTPLDDAGDFADSFDRLFILGNWRHPLQKDHAINLLGGYMHGTHHLAITSGSPATVTGIGSRFGVNSYFLETYYEATNKYAPYLRFDTLHSDEVPYGGTVFDSNPGRNTRQWTLGVAYMAAQNIRLNLEWQGTRRNPGSNQDMIRAQLWFMW